MEEKNSAQNGTLPIIVKLLFHLSFQFDLWQEFAKFKFNCPGNNYSRDPLEKFLNSFNGFDVMF